VELEMRGELPVSERLYAALLHLYPKQFRVTYGQQMRLTFRDACRVVYRQNGAGGLLALWLPTVLDLLKSALEERARQGEIVMLKERWIALAGPLTMLVGALMLLGPISDLVQLVRPPYTEALWEFFHFRTATVSLAVMLPAFVGMWLRYKESAGRLGRLGLILNVAGCVTFCLALSADFLLDVLQLLEHPTGPNYAMAASIMSILIGHVLFGIDALRYKLLPRWNAMPLLVGLTTPLLGVLSVIMESALRIDRYQVELTIATLQSATVGLCWVLLGVALMGQKQAHEAVAA
jgi:hypothetical protein